MSSVFPAEAILTDKHFKLLSEFIHSVCGIKMVPSKKTMLEGRLRKRLRALGIRSFDEYWKYLQSAEGLALECIHMVDVVTTNKTDFFRESAHFTYLFEKGLPGLLASSGAGVRSRLRTWSAGCSTGEEPYTLAMVLSEFAQTCPGFDFSILATDISTAVLKTARNATYPHDRIDPVPMPLRKKYLLKSRDKSKDLVRISPELRSRVTFQRLNFMDSDFGIRQPMDIIFCRNVLIYFDRSTQQMVLQRFCRHLHRGGLLFTGHSEALQNMMVPVEQVAASVYRRL